MKKGKTMTPAQERENKSITDAKLLALWATIVKERAGYRCEVAHCTVNAHQLHPHHYFSRRHVSLRYDPLNGICLCSRCHTLGPFSAHNDPDFKTRLIATGVRTREWEENLREKRNQIVKNNQAFREATYEELKKWGCNL